MSETDRLEARLRAFGTAPDAGADWEDVLRRAGERLSVRHISRPGLVLALAVVVVAITVAVVGVVFMHGSRHGPAGSQGPTVCDGVSVICGPTGALGPTGRNQYGPTGPIFGPTGYIGPTGRGGPTGWIDYTGPGFLTPSEIDEWFSKRLGTSIYWAGPLQGITHYEVWHYHRYFLLRYLPKGVSRGDYLSVATYPFPGAFAALKEEAEGKTVAGPNGSIIYVAPNDRRRVYVAFPNVDYEIEIYDPRPAVALATAKSGDLRPVG